MKLHRTIVAPALVAGVALVSGGWLLQQGSREDSVFQRAQLFDEVVRYVQTRYVDPQPASELYQKAIKGMLRELGDPHTTFMSAEEYAQLHLATSGEYAGVGIQIAPRDNYITAVGVLPNTPAERAGVRVGDRMIEIDGQDAKGWSDERAVKVLRGPKGSPVTIKVLRVGVDEPVTFRIVRDEIHVKSVPYAYMASPGVGYVNLTVFAETSTDEIRAAITRLKGEGMKSLVLDLRNNPGGLLNQGVSVSDLFLKSGQAIVETRARDPRESETFRARDDASYPELPVIVLVDEYSASAAEIVAGALQDHDRALVVGSPTYGKGSVQSLFPLSGGNFLKMTTAKWYTPVGRSIQKEHEEDEDGLAAEDTAEVSRSGTPMLQDTAKRQPFRTDGGRTVFGGGGIVPDLELKQDSATAVERDFFRALAKDLGKWESELLRYAVEYGRNTPGLTPDFQVTAAMRNTLFERIARAGIGVTRAQYDAAQRYVDLRLVNAIARARFGESVAAQRNDATDRVLQEALRLARTSSTQAALFRAAEAARGRQPATASRR
ncbi:MAG TPA: S41 family peptidase [Longimicrobium sp.]|jgi:carboxyl-terminal processing protease